MQGARRGLNGPEPPPAGATGGVAYWGTPVGQCLLALENGQFSSGGNDRRILVWSRDGTLQGELDRQDPESAPPGERAP